MTCDDHVVSVTLKCMFLDHLVNVTKLTRNTSHFVKEAAEGHDYIVVIDSEPRAALISLADYRLLQEIKTRTSAIAAPGELPQLETSPSRLLAALGITDIATWNPELGWHATEHDADLVVPLGVALTPDDQTGSTIVAVNLSTTVHGLMQGTTGAGKTNQLDEIALALCARYSPTRVNIIRFDGAAKAFDRSDNPAHIVFNGGHNPFSDDAADPPIHLLAAKLEHELSYRLQYLSDLGVSGYAEYLNLRRTGGHTGAPLAQLVVLIDSYTHLIETAAQDLATRLSQLVATLTQIGRTCGINLILSDQIPREPHLRPLIANIGYTVSLRTEANARLRLLPGSDASTQLPIEPGHGLLSIRPDEPMIRFRGFGVHQPLPGANNSISNAIYTQIAPASRQWMTTPSDPAQSAELIDVLGITNPAHPDIAALQQKRSQSPESDVSFPIGINSSGEPVNLDLTGSTTTGIILGANGPELIELVRNAIYSMALTHTPDLANVFYLDSHDNSIAKSIERLPHVAAAITDLAQTSTPHGEYSSERVRLALLGELARRHKLLRATGARDAAAYRQQFDSSMTTADAMPTLWIVITGHREIIRAHPQWGELLTTIADSGRAADMRITLIDRHPHRDTMAALKSSLGYRIALRTDSAEDSRAVLGSDRAYFLPQEQPGTALMRQGDNLTTFKTLSMSAQADDPVFVGEALAAAIAAASAQRTHQLWLPPLQTPSPIDALIETWRNKAWSQNYGDEDAASHLWLPIGMADRPFDLYQGVETIDLAAANILVTGDKGAGKTTTLLTLATAACLLYTPDRLSLICIGDERMRAMASYPHVAAFEDCSNRSESARLVKVAKTIRDRRADAYKTYGAAGGYGAAIVLMIDGLLQFADNSTILSMIHTLAEDTGRYGIHLIVSNASSDTAMLRDAIQIALSPDAPLHWALRSRSDGIPDSDVLIGIPRVGDSEDPNAIGDLLKNATHSVSYWKLPKPTNIALTDLLTETPHAVSVPSIPFALDAIMAEPVNLDLSQRPHFLAVGRASSGKDNALAAVAQSMMHLYTPEQLQIHVIDPSSTLVGRIAGPHVQSYCYAQQDISESLEALATELHKRLPQPGMSQAEVLEHRRAGWDGPRHVVIINDEHTLVAPDGYSDPPHAPIAKLLDRAQWIGLHVVVARRVENWDGVSVIAPLVTGIRATGSPILFLDNDPVTCHITQTLRGQQLPPGHGILLGSDAETTDVVVAMAD